MELYKALKKRKAARTRQDLDASSSTSMPPGTSYTFPTYFTIYNGPRSNDKYDKSLTCYLCTGDMQPFLSCVIYMGGGKRMVMLNGGVDGERSAPLAVVRGTESKKIRKMVLPPKREGEREVVVEMDETGGSKLVNRFEVDIGSGDGTAKQRGVFEWREAKTKGPKKECIRELIWIEDHEQVVAVFTESGSDALKQGKLGEFRFENAGASGELGEVWALAVVASALYLSWRYIVLRKAAGAILGAVGRVALFGAAMGVRAGA